MPLATCHHKQVDEVVHIRKRAPVESGHRHLATQLFGFEHRGRLVDSIGLRVEAMDEIALLLSKADQDFGVLAANHDDQPTTDSAILEANGYDAAVRVGFCLRRQAIIEVTKIKTAMAVNRGYNFIPRGVRLRMNPMSADTIRESPNDMATRAMLLA